MANSALIRVLVVDDDARVRLALRNVIDASGMQVVATAANANAALDEDERWVPAVALVDVMLPDRVDGISLVQRLSARGRAVLATSVSAAVGQEALAAGASSFIEKGPDPQRLLTELRHLAEPSVD